MLKKAAFRVLSLALFCLIFPFGVLILFEKLTHKPIVFDSTLKVGLAALVWGIVLLVIFIRGK